MKRSSRLQYVCLSFGKYVGIRAWSIPEFDMRYADWLIGQLWFGRRYPREALALATAIRFWRDPANVERVQIERRREFEVSEAERKAQRKRYEQKRLNQHRLNYEPRGIWPLGKHKGQPLAVVARDDHYCRWFKGSAYANANPGLSADLQAAVEIVVAGKTSMSAVEFHASDCTA